MFLRHDQFQGYHSQTRSLSSEFDSFRIAWDSLFWYRSRSLFGYWTEIILILKVGMYYLYFSIDWDGTLYNCIGSNYIRLWDNASDYHQLIFFFKKIGHTRPLFRLFSSFQTNITILTTNICEKMSCPSSIRRWDSNPWPSEHESPPITTRPGLPPLYPPTYLWYTSWERPILVNGTILLVIETF